MSKIKIDGIHNPSKDIFLYLKTSNNPEGVCVAAKDIDGNHLYDILTIHDGGVSLSQSKRLYSSKYTI